jgi:hypothetical protein
MPRFLLPLVLACLSGTASAQNVVTAVAENSPMAQVTAAEVEVRSGPGANYYATEIKLYRNDLVKLRPDKDQNDYLAIEPPAGSYSLVAKSVVDTTQADKGHGVVTAKTSTYVGSRLSPKPDVVGIKELNAGAIVKILGEVDNYYKIAPQEEVRYVPAGSVKVQDILLTGGSGEPPALEPATFPPMMSPPGAAAPAGSSTSHVVASAPAPAHSALDEDLRSLHQSANEAYRNSNWVEAKKCYTKLTKCDNHEVRMEAWNKLAFIDRMSPAAPAAPASLASSNQSLRIAPSPIYTAPAAPASQAIRYSPVPAPAAPAAPVRPRAMSTYAYETDSGPVRIQPIPLAPAAPAVQARFVPMNQAPAAPAAPAAAVAPVNNGNNFYGVLERSNFKSADGSSLYYLRKSNGEVQYLVAPISGLNLEGYVGKSIALEGSLFYHTNMRKEQIIASRVVTVMN